MRVAFFSPLPPSKSGIADYSSTLIEPLGRVVELECFSGEKQRFDPGAFDIALYQIGNNPHHAFAYETALRHPGVVVMHEYNLHHLIAEITIRRGDWDGYLRECEYNGGADALAFARKVRALETGPDYEGLAMTRRILESAKGVIVHSRFMLEEIRGAGFRGPVACIPHGAWIPQADRFGYRQRLGLDETVPLIGIFGHLKPYKRIAETLRAFRRVVRLAPEAKMILVGEPHPEFAVEPLIHSLGLSANVRILGFVPLDDFVGYLAACDIVVNLRYPTVGESSGTMLRALGLGKAVLVSDIGSFQEYPDEVCLKAPPGPGEEDLIFEYLDLLVARPDVARSLGEHARRYVQRECRWETVAARYAAFLEAVACGKPWEEDRAAEQPAAPVQPKPEVQPEYLTGWVAEEGARDYVSSHVTRLVRTLEITPPGGPDDRVLEMGAYMQMTPALRTQLGYGYVRGCYYGPPGRVDHKTVVSAEGEEFSCDIDHFNAEKDPFPYPDEHFSTVLCCELIEHLFEDPMHLMSEVNRILKPGGHLVLTTPNIAALRGVAAILQGYHPGFFHSYIRPSAEGEVDARHNREYAPLEIHQLLECAGFTVALLETGPFRDEPKPEYGWATHMLKRYGFPAVLRGDGIYAVGRKTGRVRERYPSWLYA